ncbi:CUGBP Elav-like family member 1 [Lates japonicus]|uniref:CUGBP Elav-like family member 1 n=1 Tax=Lates japonicus TaxID=270547 RepID=A0AAD3M2I7_LATJO|nr:CUGBP Elav-like family member 1 [Lates japonicus]
MTSSSKMRQSKQLEEESNSLRQKRNFQAFTYSLTRNSETMHLSILTLCLLAAVLHGGHTTAIPPTVTESGTTAATNTSGSTELPTGGTSGEPVTDATGASSPTATTQSTAQTAATDSSDVTTGPVTEESSGLSSGAIAGIAIGSIAGVAALGGGVFGALKYTGKI